MTALSWNSHQPTTLVVGTGLKYLRIYDMRLAGVAAGDDSGGGAGAGGGLGVTVGDDIAGSLAPLSVPAHAKAVCGVAVEPHDGRLVATFSDSAGDDVKIWDLRRLDPGSPKPVVTIRPHAPSPAPPSSGRDESRSRIVSAGADTGPRHRAPSASATASRPSAVVACVWSSRVRGSLATGCEGDGTVALWDASVGHATPLDAPLRVRTIAGVSASSGRELAALAWARSGGGACGGGCGSTATWSSGDQRVAASFPHRMLVAVRVAGGAGGSSARLEVTDVTMHEQQPLSLSPGRIQTCISKDIPLSYSLYVVCSLFGFWSLADGQAAFGCGRAIFCVRPWHEQNRELELDSGGGVRGGADGDGGDGGSGSGGGLFHDVSEAIRVRAVAGYGMDEGKNLQVLTEHHDMALAAYASASAPMTAVADGALARGGDEAARHQRTERRRLVELDHELTQLSQLVRTWIWIAHIEAEAEAEAETKTEAREREGVQTRSTLCDGIEIIIAHETTTPSGHEGDRDGSGDSDGNTAVPTASAAAEERQLSLALGCVMFRSPKRAQALRACGWSAALASGDATMSMDGDDPQLLNIMTECEMSRGFERSAALALWHGDPSAAVSVEEAGRLFLTTPAGPSPQRSLVFDWPLRFATHR